MLLLIVNYWNVNESFCFLCFWMVKLCLLHSYHMWIAWYVNYFHTQWLYSNKLYYLHHLIIPVSQEDASVTWAEKVNLRQKNSYFKKSQICSMTSWNFETSILVHLRVCTKHPVKAISFGQHFIFSFFWSDFLWFLFRSSHQGIRL